MAAIITRRILTILIAAVLNVLLSRFSEAKKIKWPTVSCRQESNTRHNVHFSTKNFFTDFIDKFKSNKLKLPNQISSPSLLFNFSGNTYLIICRIVSYDSEPGSHFARDLYYSSLRSLARRS